MHIKFQKTRNRKNNRYQLGKIYNDLWCTLFSCSVFSFPVKSESVKFYVFPIDEVTIGFYLIPYSMKIILNSLETLSSYSLVNVCIDLAVCGNIFWITGIQFKMHSERFQGRLHLWDLIKPTTQTVNTNTSTLRSYCSFK